MKITASEAELRALLAFASRDPERPSMHGIGVSEGRLAATDGVAMAILGPHPSMTWDGAAIIPYQAVLGVSFDRLREDIDECDYNDVLWDAVEIHINIESRTFSMKRGVVTVSGMLADAKFPPLHIVTSMERTATEGMAVVDSWLVSRLNTINDSRSDRFWRLSVAGATDPLRFTDRDERWTVYVMPGKFV